MGETPPDEEPLRLARTPPVSLSCHLRRPGTKGGPQAPAPALPDDASIAAAFRVVGCGARTICLQALNRGCGPLP